VQEAGSSTLSCGRTYVQEGPKEAFDERLTSRGIDLRPELQENAMQRLLSMGGNEVDSCVISTGEEENRDPRHEVVNRTETPKLI